jgi:riboflavin kinase/FMN adenylyltransferase
MISWFDEPVPYLSHTVLTMGNFDGLHLGHRKVLDQLLQTANTHHAIPVILTYLEHPGHYVHFSHPVRILTPRPCKKNLLRELGFEYVYYLNFTSQTAHVSAEEFLQEVIIAHFLPRVIITGYDTHFGYRRQGNSQFLIQNETRYEYQTMQVEPVYDQEEIISSSLIRKHLTAGQADIAHRMLGQPYRLYGKVTYGKQLGTVIGYPTINLNLLDPEQLIPANGIYLTRLLINGTHYFGLTNIGISPTLKNSGQIEIETHILDFNQNIYDEDIELDFLDYIRAEQRFSKVEDLQTAIANDIAIGKELIKSHERNF